MLQTHLSSGNITSACPTQGSIYNIYIEAKFFSILDILALVKACTNCFLQKKNSQKHPPVDHNLSSWYSSVCLRWHHWRGCLGPPTGPQDLPVARLPLAHTLTLRAWDCSRISCSVWTQSKMPKRLRSTKLCITPLQACCFSPPPPTFLRNPYKFFLNPKVA